MLACKFVIVFTILGIFQLVDNKESDAFTDLLGFLKKLSKTKNEDAEAISEEVTKTPKASKLEERLEKYFEKRFPWWPKQQIEDLDATEKPTTQATPLDGLVTSYMNFLTYLFKIF